MILGPKGNHKKGVSQTTLQVDNLLLKKKKLGFKEIYLIELLKNSRGLCVCDLWMDLIISHVQSRIFV